MNKKIKYILFFVGVLLPGFVLAAPGLFIGNLTDLADNVATLVKNILWTIAIVFVIVMFVIAGFKFLTAQGNSQKVAEARNAVLWGLVGVVVIILAWSIVTIVSTQLGV